MDDWFTPNKYIEAAREVMGSINLDPASCEIANRTVKAAKYYTEEQDGLKYEWHGNIWLNAPYKRVSGTTGGNQSYQKLFNEKLLVEYNAGRVKQAITLVLGNSFYMKWYRSFFPFPVCIHSGHIYFTRLNGSKGHFGFGTAFVYLGESQEQFIDVFRQFGPVMRQV